MTIKRLRDLQFNGFQVNGGAYPISMSFDLSNAVGGEYVLSKQTFVFDVDYVSAGIVDISVEFNGVTYSKDNFDLSLNPYSYFGRFEAEGDYDGDILISFYNDFGFSIYDENSANWLENDMNANEYYAINSFIATDDSEQILGTANGEMIFAEGGDDVVLGLGGDDIIYGGEGNDKSYGNDGDDIIYGDAGDDRIFGGNGEDSLNGGDGNDIILGGSGNDYISGSDGNDVIYGGGGNDELHAGDGDDYLNGGDGDDYISAYVSGGNNILVGGAGNDELWSSINFDDGTIEWLYGGDGNDFLRASRGENHLYGGDGDDYLTMGEDMDYLYGGAGNDIFAFEFVLTGDGIIKDFEQGADKVYIEYDDHLTVQTYDSVQMGAASGSTLGYTHDLVNNQTLVHGIYPGGNSSDDFNTILEGIYHLTENDFIY
jgi:Ca2+-binding RTX toxin-like protein